jgi:hypothetical protein
MHEEELAIIKPWWSALTGGGHPIDCCQGLSEVRNATRTSQVAHVIS